MKRDLSIFLLAFVGLFAVSVNMPELIDTGRWLASGPQRARLEQRQRDSRTKWASFAIAAEDGNVQAQAAYGVALLGPFSPDWKGIQPDHIAGAKYIAAAASAGDPASIVLKWQLNGADSGQLMVFVPSLLESEVSSTVLWELHGWIAWATGHSDTCTEDLLDLSQRIADRIETTTPQKRAPHVQQNLLLESQACTRSRT